MARATKRRTPTTSEQSAGRQSSRQDAYDARAATKGPPGGVSRLTFDGVKSFDVTIYSSTKSPAVTPLCNPELEELEEPAESAALPPAGRQNHGAGGGTEGDGKAAAQALMQLSIPVASTADNQQASYHARCRPGSSRLDLPRRRGTAVPNLCDGGGAVSLPLDKLGYAITKKNQLSAGVKAKMVMAVLPQAHDRPNREINRRELLRWVRVAMMAASEN
eukprot:COSAG05_NODE_454_length_9643_cov_5.989627_10_plen_219_part_00